jgi:hypothetical protein
LRGFAVRGPGALIKKLLFTSWVMDLKRIVVSNRKGGGKIAD